MNSIRVMRAEPLESRRLLAGDAPSFVELGDQTVEVGAPLHLPIDGFDADGGPLTVSVEVSNPDAVTAELITGNRSLRLEVASFGTMVFELYEGRAPRPTARIIELTEAGFYDGIIFHRIVDDFVLQAGDPNGTGQTGSELGTFDDQFHPDLQHNRNGILSFAKTTADDTNNSQFFITERETNNTRNLDFNHSVFGQLIEGEDVRESISEVPVDGPPTNRPLTDVVIESATIFEDIENSIVMLRAIGAGAQSDVTITITDAEGNSSFETFSVNTISDQDNAGPYLVDPAPILLAPAGQDISLPLTALDIEGDAQEFLAGFNRTDFGTSNVNPLTSVLEPINDELQLDLNEDFVGEIGVIVGVRALTGNFDHIDTQQFTIQVVDTLAAPTSIDLAATSDTGIADDDNITSASNLTIQVDGVSPGADVELVNQADGEVLVQVRATGSTADLEFALADDFFGENQLDGALEIIARQRTGNLISEVGDSLEIQIDRTAPELTSSPIPSHLFAGALLSETLATNESSGRLSLVSGPDGMTVDESTGQITWTPASELRGLQPLTIGIEDAAGNMSQTPFSINVTSRYFNPVDAFDVDGSGTVDSLDALLIINAVSRNQGEIALPETDGSETSPSSLRQDFFYNANNDDAITVLDALVVVNAIASQQTRFGPDLEGEVILPNALSPSNHRLRDTKDKADEHSLLF